MRATGTRKPRRQVHEVTIITSHINHVDGSSAQANYAPKRANRAESNCIYVCCTQKNYPIRTMTVDIPQAVDAPANSHPRSISSVVTLNYSHTCDETHSKRWYYYVAIAVVDRSTRAKTNIVHTNAVQIGKSNAFIVVNSSSVTNLQGGNGSRAPYKLQTRALIKMPPQKW